MREDFQGPKIGWVTTEVKPSVKWLCHAQNASFCYTSSIPPTLLFPFPLRESWRGDTNVRAQTYDAFAHCIFMHHYTSLTLILSTSAEFSH